MQRLKMITVTSCVAALTMTAAPVAAHHSYSMFDQTKVVTLEGTVKEFQWTNPHVWLQISVKDKAGKDVLWELEGDSPNGLSRIGWKRSSLKPGDKAVVRIHPLKDGSAGGELRGAVVNGVPVGAGKPAGSGS